MGYHLTLQTGSEARSKSRAEETMAALAADVPASAGWEPRLAFNDPDEEDCAVVEEMIEEGENEAVLFRAFCRECGVEVGTAASDPLVCAAFVDQQWGAPVGYGHATSC